MTADYEGERYGVAVIGAGHAGLEAALACARMGVKTALFTLTLDLVGNMPCNPSIGGTAKGHLVRELDALGGEMGRAADAVMIQSRMLNPSKGPAVQSLRMQADRVAYRDYMKKTAEHTENLDLIQAEVTAIDVKDGRTAGVITAFGGYFPVGAAIIATGTSLKGRVIVGEHTREAGPDNTVAASRLSESLSENGIDLVRFKTGTPPRVRSDSVDYSLMERQPGDDYPVMFTTENPGTNRRDCYITYTNPETHRIIRENLHRSPLFSGEIKGTGPRYCPSIEDKIVKFPDRERHQIFVEPMGLNTEEVYLQGLSSSLPEDVQKQIVHSIRGLEHAVFMRTAYAIEYDCCDPTELYPTLEFKSIRGLYGAGQFNGSSGYEEAAAQGIVAGINAALKLQGREPLILKRSESYIGTLIDDLVSKGTNEPYRMMTSRSEYRLLLRQDNAAQRLIEYGRYAGLVSDEKYSAYLSLYGAVEEEKEYLRTHSLPGGEVLDSLLIKHGYEPTGAGMRMAELLRRPGITHAELCAADGRSVPRGVARRAETELKYEGYIKKELEQVARFSKLESKALPADQDYTEVKGIRTEAAQKLNKFRPASIGQASRISGISPADISVLLIWLEQRRRNGQNS